MKDRKEGRCGRKVVEGRYRRKEGSPVIRQEVVRKLFVVPKYFDPWSHSEIAESTCT